MTEGDLKAAILSEFLRIGVTAWKVSQGRRGRIQLGVYSQRNPVGFPDLLCCVGGVFVAIEVKLPGKEEAGKHVAAQKKCRGDIRVAGGIAEVVTSVQGAIDVVMRVRSP